MSSIRNINRREPSTVRADRPSEGLARRTTEVFDDDHWTTVHQEVYRVLRPASPLTSPATRRSPGGSYSDGSVYGTPPEVPEAVLESMHAEDVIAGAPSLDAEEARERPESDVPRATPARQPLRSDSEAAGSHDGSLDRSTPLAEPAEGPARLMPHRLRVTQVAHQSQPIRRNWLGKLVRQEPARPCQVQLEKDGTVLTGPKGDVLKCKDPASVPVTELAWEALRPQMQAQFNFFGHTCHPTGAEHKINLLNIPVEFINGLSETEFETFTVALAKAPQIHVKWHNAINRERLHHHGVTRRYMSPITVLAFAMQIRGDVDAFSRIFIRWPQIVIADVSYLSAGSFFEPHFVGATISRMAQILALRSQGPMEDLIGRQWATAFMTQYFLFYHREDSQIHRNPVLKVFDKITHHNRMGQHLGPEAMDRALHEQFLLAETMSQDEAQEVLAITFAGAANAALELMRKDQLSLDLLDMSVTALLGFATLIPHGIGAAFAAESEAIKKGFGLIGKSEHGEPRNLLETSLRRMFSQYVNLSAVDYKHVLGVTVPQEEFETFRRLLRHRISTVAAAGLNLDSE